MCVIQATTTIFYFNHKSSCFWNISYKLIRNISLNLVGFGNLKLLGHDILVMEFDIGNRQNNSSFNVKTIKV